MRIALFLVSVAITIALIIILNSKLVLPVPLGKLLSPQHGLWQNAEPVNEDFTADLNFPGLAGKVNVYLDGRLVPHIFAEQENDAYFVQGYIHAKFRLWQMELQTHAAAGRASEIIGDKALDHDREFRRLGMVYAAERSLKEMETDPVTKAECDAYTAGVNSYIAGLTESQLPLEYKLLGYRPEKWNNLKTALFLKYMSYDLAGHDDDFAMTHARNFFSKEDFEKIYPAIPDSTDPIVSGDSAFLKPAINLKVPATADSLYFKPTEITSVSQTNPDKDNGSNNWALSGKRTKSGFPVLCNDPHLGLSLPSLWFEMQISAPGLNVYGATFPGAPGIIIGFNDSCAFGFTNGGRDVKDYYEMKFRDASRQQYWFNDTWKNTSFRIEKIKVKDKDEYLDTVAYTLFGPVMYDKKFNEDSTINNKDFAVRWKAHDPSNDLKCFNLLNRAKNYQDYSVAVTYLHTPGQNCAFACKNGDIAIKTQGEFPAKWPGQGDFIMPGTDSSFMWQGMIPQNETPFQYNPERGFVSSANQRPADSSYPYYLGSGYPPYRGLIINRKLAQMNSVTPQDMMRLQTDNYNVFAEMARPVFLKNINQNQLSDNEKKYLQVLSKWDLKNELAGATVFYHTWKNFTKVVWTDEFAKATADVMQPYESTLLEGVLKDSAYTYLDNITTPQKETLEEDVTVAFKAAVIELKAIDSADRLNWIKYKDTKIMHLTKLEAFSRMHLPIGGGTHCINATKQTHGPSWRMIVSLTPQTEAYGVYPGGQSGNPGSAFYDTFIDTWAAGKYYPLWVMKPGEQNNTRIKWKMMFSPA